MKGHGTHGFGGRSETHAQKSPARMRKGGQRPVILLYTRYPIRTSRSQCTLSHSALSKSPTYYSYALLRVLAERSTERTCNYRRKLRNTVGMKSVSHRKTLQYSSLFPHLLITEHHLSPKDGYISRFHSGSSTPHQQHSPSRQ